MSSTLESDDKIWGIFLGYVSLIGTDAKESGIDVYGTDQLTNIAKSLTVAHMLDHVVCQMKDLQKQQATIQRSKHYLKENKDFQVM